MISIKLLATDQQCSVLNTLKANHPPQTIVYSPYGHRPAASGLLSMLGFNGEIADPVTGHYLLGNGYRAFNPVLMRFNSPDSLSPFGEGELNAYAYCLGDPVNVKDPTGRATGQVFLLRVVRPIRRVEPNMAQVPRVRDLPPATHRPVAQNVASPPPRARVPNNEYSRAIEVGAPSPDAPTNTGMRVTQRNAVETPSTAAPLSPRTDNVSRVTEISGDSNTQASRTTGFPTEGQPNVRSLAFDIRRRNQQRAEATPLRRNRTYQSANE